MVPHLFVQIMALLNRFENFTLESFGYLLSGGTSAAIALIILYPIEQMNVRSTVSSDARSITLKSIFYDFVYLKMENIADIYRGLSFSIIEKFVFIGTYFFFYSLLNANDTDASMSIALFRGAFAGILTQIFTSPLGTIQKILQTTHKSDKRNTNPTAIINNVPLCALWSGLTMNVILVFNPAINMYLYEHLTDHIAMGYIFGDALICIHFVSGLLSKLMATLICYPFIYIKNNQQSSQQHNEPKTIRDVVKMTCAEYGFCGFYKGFKTKIAQTTLNNALMFVLKERVDVFVMSKLEYLHHAGMIFLSMVTLLFGFAAFRCFKYVMDEQENKKLSNELKECVEPMLCDQSNESVYVQTI